MRSVPYTNDAASNPYSTDFSPNPAEESYDRNSRDSSVLAPPPSPSREQNANGREGSNEADLYGGTESDSDAYITDSGGSSQSYSRHSHHSGRGSREETDNSRQQRRIVLPSMGVGMGVEDEGRGLSFVIGDDARMRQSRH